MVGFFDMLGGFCGCTVRMHPHMAEIMAKAWIKEVAGGGVKRLTAAFQAVDSGFKAWGD